MVQLYSRFLIKCTSVTGLEPHDFRGAGAVKRCGSAPVPTMILNLAQPVAISITFKADSNKKTVSIIV
jgi:hypothetical protein